MSNSSKGNGKSKKIVIGVATIVAVAAIAVPTALTLTAGNKESAGASGNETNKYNIIVSTGHESVPDYSLSIEKGTTISELKTLLKAIDGYTITGIYKDEAMNHPYADNEIITSDVKIYIEFTALSHIVNIYAEDGTTLLESQEVSHKDSITLTAPTKAEDNFATYEFKGWYNERNELVNLNEITSDLNIHPEYRTIMKEYKMGYIGGEFKDSISVTIGGTPVTLESTYHYGAKIVIRATQNVGRDITEFKVKVGSGETQNILTETYRHEENGQVYYEYELDGNGDLSITYNEAASEYSIGTIPSQVTVTRNGHTLSSNETIYYGDVLEIKYYEDYDVEVFEVSGANIVPGIENTYSVTGNINIIFEGTYKYAYLTFTECDGGYEVTGCSELVTEVIVPAKFRGKNVISIAYWAFNNKENITSVILPKSLTKISSMAFSYCRGLREIVIPEGVENIYSQTFEHCSSLTKVIIPESVKNIGSSAFFGCSSLGSISLPSGLNIINYATFGNCSSLTSIIIPDSVTSIEDNAFSGCSKLNEIVLPNNLKSLGNYAFSSCGSLTSVNLPESLENFGDYTFNGCSSLTSIRIPDSITILNTGLFTGCNSLNSISIPNSVNKIGYSAFSYCLGLNTILIPSSVTEIEGNAFEGCENLQSIIIESSEIYRALIGKEYGNAGMLLGNATTVKILSSIDDGSNTFLSKYVMTTEGSYNIYDLTQEKSPLIFTECDGGYEVSGFNKTSGVTEVVIPETYNGTNVVGIANSAFQNCTSITNISIPNNITKIGDYAFYGCSGLTSITVPSSITNIGTSVFERCSKLTSINLSEGLINIGYYSFKDCPKLTSIEIPSSVASINSTSFFACKFRSIKVAEGNTTFTSRDNLGNEINLLINVKTNTLVKGNNSSTVEIPSSVSAIGDYAFFECGGLKSINIPGNVKSIGYCAFNRTGLNSLIISEGVTTIGGNAFANCSYLDSVTISSTVTKIELGSFGNCTITKLVIDSSIIYKAATNKNSAVGGLLQFAYTIKVLKTADDGTNTFLNNSSNYTKTESGDYYVYTRK